MTVLGAGMCAAGLVAAVIGFCSPRLPDPATADRNGLLRWVVTQDLSQEPYERRLVLARRLEHEFGERVDWPAIGNGLTAEQKQRLWDNVLVLLEPWFADKVDGYFGVPEAKRPAFVDRTLELIENWRGAAALCAGPPPGAGDGKRPGLLEVFAERVARWTRSASPQRGDQVRQFLLAVQTRWFQRALLGAGQPRLSETAPKTP